VQAVRIVLVNDNHLLAAALQARVELDDRFDIVGVAKDATEAARLVDEQHPDVVLIDAGATNGGSLEATRLIASSETAPRVLILADPENDLDAVEAHDAGAAAFLQKPRSAADLLDTLELAAVLAQVHVAPEEPETEPES
jgi:DNA-binding NarL/FixJ family response regulator